MLIQHLSKATIALLAGLTLATACSATESTSTTNETQGTSVAVAADPCAGADPCAASVDVAAETVAAETVAETTPVETIRYFVDGNNLAIRGTDPVAYFTEGRPVTGSAEFTYTWNNATWQFASAENRDSFTANPEAYAPQYGGFCAWAVSQGYTASIDPNAWKIVDGKLYLNYSNSVQRNWERDIPGHISKADANWPGVLTGS
ncbi:MAG: YHS domain-containing (seleno)protein [Cyanobacteria bacterium P01_D01_bin.156]